MTAGRSGHTTIRNTRTLIRARTLRGEHRPVAGHLDDRCWDLFSTAQAATALELHLLGQLGDSTVPPPPQMPRPLSRSVRWLARSAHCYTCN
jgi:hypothetical protein